MSAQIVSLGEVLSVDSRSIIPEKIRDCTTYVGLESIGVGGWLDESVTVRAGQLKSAKFAFDSRHVLFGKLRPNLGKVARPSGAGICSTDIYPLLPSERLDRSYLAHFLLKPESIAKAASRTAGVNLPRISAGVLKSFHIPLPPLPEQRRIAAILDQADELRAKRRRALALLDELADSIFIDMFGADSTSSPQWRVVPVSHFTLGFQSGKSLLSPAEGEEASAQARVLKISSVTTGEFIPGESKPLPTDYNPPIEHFVHEGDLLLTRANTADLVGACAYVWEEPVGLVLPDKLWRFKWSDSKGLEPLFIRAAMSRPDFRRSITNIATGSSGSMKNISQAGFLDLRLIWPDQSLRRMFGMRMRAIRELVAMERNQLHVVDELFASLQHRAFRGEL